MTSFFLYSLAMAPQEKSKSRFICINGFFSSLKNSAKESFLTHVCKVNFYKITKIMTTVILKGIFLIVNLSCEKSYNHNNPCYPSKTNSSGCRLSYKFSVFLESSL